MVSNLDLGNGTIGLIFFVIRVLLSKHEKRSLLINQNVSRKGAQIYCVIIDYLQCVHYITIGFVNVMLRKSYLFNVKITCLPY